MQAGRKETYPLCVFVSVFCTTMYAIINLRHCLLWMGYGDLEADLQEKVSGRQAGSRQRQSGGQWIPVC